MTDSNDNQFSNTTSSGKSGESPYSQNRFPESGSYPPEEWARIWGVSTNTVHEWVKKYKIPVWGPSSKNYMIEASDFKGAFTAKPI